MIASADASASIAGEMNTIRSQASCGPSQAEKTGRNLQMKANDEKILSALIAHKTIGEAARVAGVSERTIYSRLADDDFRAEYEARQKCTLDNACKALQSALTDAVDVLKAIMNDTDTSPGSRITAARSVLEYGVKLTELTDLAARVAALEAREASR